MTNASDDDDDFLQEMGDVKPLQLEKKVALKRDNDSELARSARREAAAEDVAKDPNHLSSDYIELLGPHCPLEFKRPGVQNGVFRKLKQGKYSQEARLDLHRMTVETARAEVFDFIKECASYELRSLIIIHGKGSHSKADVALLKSHVNKWLPDMGEVLAFCSAQPQHGGMGAVYVMLGKSERSKQGRRRT